MDVEVIISCVILLPAFTLTGVVWVVCYSHTHTHEGNRTFWLWVYPFVTCRFRSQNKQISRKSCYSFASIWNVLLCKFNKGLKSGECKDIYKCEWWVRSHGVNETLLNISLAINLISLTEKHSNTPAWISPIAVFVVFFVFFCFTVTDAGSNSGIFGTAGSGGLAGAGAGAGADAGLGSSFFLGAMAGSSEDSGRGATRRRETEQTQDGTQPPSQTSQAPLFSEHRYLHPPSWLQQ